MMDADLKYPSPVKNVIEKRDGLTELLRGFPCLENEGWLNEGFTFGDIQRIIFAEGKSGYMNILKGEVQFRALFDRGRLVDLVWKNRPLERRLGQILLKNRAITEETLNDALNLSGSANRRLGSVLLSLDSIPPDRIEKLLDLHLSETLSLLFSPNGGKYEFKEEEVKKDGMMFDPFIKKFQLQGNSPWLENMVNAYLVDTQVENLKFLPCGLPIHNPSLLISSRRFEVVLSVLKDIFEYILLDAPPLFLADAATLSQYSDATLLVLKSGSTRPEEAKKAVDILNGAGAHIIGAVLNGVDLKRDKYYYKKYYGKDKE
jgi:capsular exopolysaccharide synthesis family protein